MMVLVMTCCDLPMVPARETARESATTVVIAVKDRRGDTTQFFHGNHHGALVLPT